VGMAAAGFSGEQLAGRAAPPLGEVRLGAARSVSHWLALLRVVLLGAAVPAAGCWRLFPKAGPGGDRHLRRHAVNLNIPSQRLRRFADDFRLALQIPCSACWFTDPCRVGLAVAFSVVDLFSAAW